MSSRLLVCALVVLAASACTINEPLVRVDRLREFRRDRGYLVAHFYLDPAVNGQRRPIEWTDAVGVPYADFHFRDPQNVLRKGSVARSGYLVLEVIPGRYRFVGLKICLGIWSCDQKIRVPGPKKPTGNPTLPPTSLEVRPGELLYLGDLRMLPERRVRAVGDYRFVIEQHPARARAHLEREFPHLRGRFRTLRVRLLELPLRKGQ